MSQAILFALVLIVVVNFVFKNSRFGYRVRACGGNRLAAETAGINSGRITIQTMFLSGAISGPVSYTHLDWYKRQGVGRGTGL